jgi:hypothetical protein
LGINQLIAAYEETHKNRKLQVVALFGQVELCLDKKFNFRISTGQASILLRIAEVGGANLEAIAEFMQVDLRICNILIKPMVNLKLLCVDDRGIYTICRANSLHNTELDQTALLTTE